MCMASAALIGQSTESLSSLFYFGGAHRYCGLLTFSRFNLDSRERLFGYVLTEPRNPGGREQLRDHPNWMAIREGRAGLRQEECGPTRVLFVGHGEAAVPAGLLVEEIFVATLAPAREGLSSPLATRGRRSSAGRPRLR